MSEPMSKPNSAKPRLARIAKGKRPQYFSDPATDKLLSMTMTLMEELSVTRERLDSLERLLSSKTVIARSELESWTPDAEAGQERAAARAAYVERMMRAMHAELDEITRRGSPSTDIDPLDAVGS
jgi:hypothetical protein